VIRRATRAAVALLVTTVAALALGCSSKTTPAGLELVLQTDLHTPADFDTLHLEVSQETSPGHYGSMLVDNDFEIPSEATLPTTFAIAPGKSADQVAHVVLTAKKGSMALVQREVLIQVPNDRVAALPLVIATECLGKLTCASGQSCQPDTGECAPTQLIDPKTLLAFSASDLLDAGVPTSGGASPDATLPEEGDASAEDADGILDATTTMDGGPGLDAGAGGGNDSGGTPEAAAPLGPKPTVLPTYGGACPAFANGMNNYSLPVGDAGGTFPFTVWAGTGGGGPLVIYWHGTASSASEASTGLGDAGIATITAMGGMVVAPSQTTTTGTNTGDDVWYTGDVTYIDAIVACAISQRNIDTRHIHVAGYSSGGLQTVYMWWARSNYVASVLSYSGGDIGPNEAPFADPSNVAPAIAAHGAMGSDELVVDFYTASHTWETDIQKANGFAIDCNDGANHTALATRTAIAPQAVQFFLDHPYKVKPEPYRAGLPNNGWPSYCQIVSVPAVDGGGPRRVERALARGHSERHAELRLQHEAARGAGGIHDVRDPPEDPGAARSTSAVGEPSASCRLRLNG
jgi:hypothetical protein